MNIVKCSGPGCKAIFQTEEPVSKNATYTCREHTKQAPDKVRLQRYQHDEKLGKSVGEKPTLERHDRNDK
jgi:hypothetical protein